MADTLSSMKLFSVSDVCAITGRSRSAIYQDLKSGLLPAVKCGRRTFVRSSDLEAFITGMDSYPVDESDSEAPRSFGLSRSDVAKNGAAR